jgi:hypothetical protein
VFLAFEPHTGFRYVEVRARRTAVDEAEFMKTLSARHYPPAESLCLVQDKLNTHTPGSFSEVLAPDQAFELAKRCALHDTPHTGSWLNRAEIEFAVLSHQCLDRRLPSFDLLRREVLAWADKHHRERQTVHWRFAPKDARNTRQRHDHKVQKFN